MAASLPASDEQFIERDGLMSSWLALLERADLFKYALVLSIPFYLLIAKIVFGGWNDFWDAVRLLLQPDWLSMLRGEWHQDCWSSLKFLFYLIACAAMVTGVYKLLLVYF